MKNIETPDTFQLHQLIDKIRNGAFVIPDFQREFEWEPGQVQELMRSIFEDYYIGTLLLWRSTQENAELLSCESIYGHELDGANRNRANHIVLDGQQRLSAIHYALIAPDTPFPKRKNRFIFYIDLEAFLAGEYEDAFHYDWFPNRVEKILNDREMQFAEKLFPLSILKDSFAGLYPWMEEYEKYWKQHLDDDQAEAERKEIQNLLYDILSSYEVSYIELDRDIEVSKVCDIFTRINSTGTPLNIFDLMNALLRPKGIFLKEEWRKISEQLGDFEWRNTKVRFMQTMSILEQGYCAPKYLYYLVPESTKTIKHPEGSKEEITLIKSADEFTDKWNFAVNETMKAIEMLKDPQEYGAIQPDFLPYPTMLPIVAALNIERREDDYSQCDGATMHRKIHQWYWASIFTQRYSSAVDSQMTQDFYAMKRWFLDDTNPPAVVEEFRREVDNLDLHRETSRAAAVYKAVFNILVKNEARDWYTFDLPQYSALNDHHIVPRSWGIDQGLGKEIDTILNRTPLSDVTNQHVISNKLPNEYLRDMLDRGASEADFYAAMESHLISRKAVEILMREDFSPEDYHEFIEERRKTIIRKIKSILQLSEDQPVESM